MITLQDFLCHMKETISNEQIDYPFYLDKVSEELRNGNKESAIDWCIRALHKARIQQNKPRIQQFSNLIHSHL